MYSWAELRDDVGALKSQLKGLWATVIIVAVLVAAMAAITLLPRFGVPVLGGRSLGLRGKWAGATCAGPLRVRARRDTIAKAPNRRGADPMARATRTTREILRDTALGAVVCTLAAAALLLVAGCRPPALQYPPVKQAPPLVEPSEPTTAHAEASETTPAQSALATAGLKPVFSNPTFDGGLSTWVVYDFKPTTSPGTNILELVPVAGRPGQSLHVARTSDRDSGGSGATQRLSLDCSRIATLRVSFSAAVSLGTGGNLAGTRTGVAPDAPVMVRVKYVDTKGRDREYYHGLYTGEATGADSVHFQQVGQGQWVSWVSPNLMDLPDTPKRVTEVTFCGFGWSFDSMLDDCQLWSGP